MIKENLISNAKRSQLIWKSDNVRFLVNEMETNCKWLTGLKFRTSFQKSQWFKSVLLLCCCWQAFLSKGSRALLGLGFNAKYLQRCPSPLCWRTSLFARLQPAASVVCSHLPWSVGVHTSEFREMNELLCCVSRYRRLTVWLKTMKCIN